MKDTFREIKRTLSRFLSIFAIVALGVSFFAGVKATSPDMKLTADKYFDDYRLMDIKLLSTMGFNDDDIKAVERVPGIEGVLPTYSMDALVDVGEKELVIKVLGLPIDKMKGDDKSYINRVKLVEGRLPEKPGECVTERGKMLNPELSIGSKIKLSSGTDKDISESLKVNEYTIVGIVETPYYISFERGTSSIGSGKINSFIMVPQEDFKIPVYTDVFLTVKGARELFCYDDEYDKIVEPVKNALEDTGKARAQIRYDEIISEANAKLEESKKELSEGEEEQKSELAKAASRLESARKQIAKGEEELKNKENEFNKTIKEAEAKINDGYVKLQEGEKEYNQNLQLFIEKKRQAEKELPAAEQQLNNAQKELEAKEPEINQLKEYLAITPNLPEEERHAKEAIIKEYERQREELEKSRAVLEANKKDLSDAEAQLISLRKTLDASKTQLDNEKKTLEASKSKALKELAAARKKLDSSKWELQKGEEEYERQKRESDEKLADARRKIADGEKEISKLEKPKWYVLDRNMHMDFVDYEKAADRIDAIARVFPAFFFLVAALVCLTTMTRMVDEQRINIGTLKALGYGKLSIASKYLLYAMLASFGGSIFGVLAGFKVFPTVIFNAYGIIYTLPPVITNFNVFYAVISTAFAVLVTTAAAWAACYKELMVEPAILMRPKAPKLGKRIFLERINFLWTRFNFIQKVTARNIFRYKKRFFMTVLGIGGCTALLLSGFGLKDSIVSIVTKQFDELYQYDMIVSLKENTDLSDIKEIIDTFGNNSKISDYMFMKEQNIYAVYGNNEKSATLVIPESTERLKDFITLRVRTTGEKVSLTNEGVVLTEKLAKMLGVQKGDDIYIKEGDTKKTKVKIIGITENYVSHYVYMSPTLYESLYGEKVKFQQIAAKTIDTSEAFENKLSTDLLKNSKISSVSFTTGISKNFKDIIGSLNYVVLVLIVSAGVLAFVVLYNLTNINITERLREIATIKVLGFYDNEVSAYVYRENMVLTMMGMALGLLLGIFLHKFIVETAEIDYVMFGRNINILSYIYSSILTIFFSVIVNFVMYFRLTKIDMVESLKSVD
ncbi:putative ABC transport system permease protein [Fonticella tunisiensis]|uniref:Putative ABC transport system permease protein n=2 Tax=Fonticella tunisiensis TaxID=1096341 RepID=A0A4R7KU45_9CLOT|nr:putative ABC transport system permease protein [Fonticella tunisiensis]